ELDRRRAVAFRDALRGLEHRGEDLLAAVARADVGEVGPALVPDAVDRVAADAHGLVARLAEDLEAVRRVAAVVEREAADFLEAGDDRFAVEEGANRRPRR